MNEDPKQETTDSDFFGRSEIVARQEALGKRLLWLLIVPFVITAVVVVMFFKLSSQLTDVQVGTEIVTIERYLLVDKNYQWAIDRYERIAQTYSRAPVLARLGMLYFLLDPKNAKNVESALRRLEQASNADPNNWETYRNLTYIYLATNRPGDAIRAGQRALQLDSNDANTYNNLAWIYATTEDPAIKNLDLAQQFGERAVSLTKELQPDFLDTLAEVYFREGKTDSAIACFRKAIASALDPGGTKRNVREHFQKLFPNETL